MQPSASQETFQCGKWYVEIKWLKNVSIYCPVSNSFRLRILVGMLFGYANFLDIKFEITLIFLLLCNVRRKTSLRLGGGKYWKKVLYIMASDWTSAATEQKKSLEVFAIVCVSVTVWFSRLDNYFLWIICHFLRREIMDLIPLQVFFMLLIFYYL